jgi:hypothetical protein
MSGGPKRNPDKLNTIGVVVVGVCGAVLVYVTIVALQAFYMGDTSEVQTMADYGGNDLSAMSTRANQIAAINKYEQNAAALDPTRQTWKMPINRAMAKVVEDMKKDPAHGGSNLVPGIGPSTLAYTRPVFGRPVKLETGSGSGSGSAGSGSSAEPTPETGSGSGSGSAAPTPETGSAGSGSAKVAPAAGSGSAVVPAPAPAQKKAEGSGAASPGSAAKGDARP